MVKQQKSCIVIFLLIWLRVGIEGKYGLIFPHSTVILVFNSKTNEKYYNLFNVNIEKWLGIWKNNLKKGALNLTIFSHLKNHKIWMIFLILNIQCIYAKHFMSYPLMSLLNIIDILFQICTIDSMYIYIIHI